MGHWNPDNEIVYRLDTDPPGEWRAAGTLAQIEREWQRQCKQADVYWLMREVARANARTLGKSALQSAFANRLN